MQLSFTAEQLTSEIIAGILNQAFIDSEIKCRENGSSYVWSKLLNMGIVIESTSRGIQFTVHQYYNSEVSKDELIKVANYMDWLLVDSTYVCQDDDGDHVMRFHYQLWIPEDESVSAGYLVKLTRSFASAMDKINDKWIEIYSAALEAE